MTGFITGPFWDGLTYFFLLGQFLDFWVEMRRREFAKGSHGRFVFASIQRVTEWSAVACWTTHLIHGIVLRDPFGLAISVVWIYLAVRIIRAHRSNDDDDWSKQTGRRLRKKVRSLIALARQISVAGPVPVGAAA